MSSRIFSAILKALSNRWFVDSPQTCTQMVNLVIFVDIGKGVAKCNPVVFLWNNFDFLSSLSVSSSKCTYPNKRGESLLRQHAP